MVAGLVSKKKRGGGRPSSASTPTEMGNHSHLYICKKDSMIIKSGGKWQVRSKSGRRLGTHETRERASRQLAAIEASMARREQGKP